MRIGLDIHGVIDTFPDYFRELSYQAVTGGHEVHIITGQEWEKAYETVKEYGIHHARRETPTKLALDNFA